MDRHEEILLYDRREIYVWGGIDADSAFRFVRQLRYLAESGSDIFVFIHSEGGELDALASMIDEITIVNKKCNVFLIVHGKAYSSGAILLAAAKPGYAFATKNSSIMLHPCSYELPEDYKSAQEAYSKFTNDMFNKLLRLLSTRIKKRVKTIERDIKDTLWLDVDDAIKYGIIDGVWE